MGARVTEGTFDGAEVGHRRSIGQVAFASFIGTAVEWYDFFVYGTAAALVFPKLFFPRFDPLAGTLGSFATFGVGFFARPIGGARLRPSRRSDRSQVHARYDAAPHGWGDFPYRAPADIRADWRNGAHPHRWRREVV
jgi:hypothetical protein